jgi:manganese/zinc/iron transport system substrate-binding protein
MKQCDNHSAARAWGFGGVRRIFARSVAAAVVLLAPYAASADEGHDDAALESPVVAKPYDGAYPIRVLTTTGMVADLARNVGGEHVEVEALMGEGVDPHLYKATPGDIRTLRGADLILFNGLHLEGKMAEILLKLARLKPTFAATEGLDWAKLREPPEFQGNYDPHVWFDVALWSECADYTRDVLIALDPPHADDYRRNAEAYRKELADLDAYTRAQLATIPAERRVLVTAHDAFGYFGRAYDVEVLAIQGISTESEAGVYKINELVATIAQRKVKAVFVETSVSDKNIRALVEGCRSQGHALRIGGSLYSDAMGKAGTPDGTYDGMVRKNVDTIVGALK